MILHHAPDLGDAYHVDYDGCVLVYPAPAADGGLRLPAPPVGAGAP